MFKFIDSHPNGLPQKRKQSSKACQQCRKSKKRCSHIKEKDDNILAGPRTQTTTPTPTPAPRNSVDADNQDRMSVGSGRGKRSSTSSRPPTRVSEPAKSIIDSGNDSSACTPSVGGPFNRDSHGHHLSLSASAIRRVGQSTVSPPSLDQSSPKARHIGDLNPESIFLAVASPATNVIESESSNVGIWIKENQAGTTKTSYSNFAMRQPRSTALYGSDPLIRQLLLPYLEEQCLSLIPDQQDYGALRLIYFAKVHPILPILDHETFDSLDPSLSSTIVLKQGVCLAASMHQAANSHLRLPGATSLDRAEFVNKLSSAMKTSLDLGLVTDKIVLIQALCLLYLFTQGTDGGDLPAELCSRAVHHTFTIGLHLPEREKLDDRAEKLFCSVWALSTLNAAFHGRPVLMHDRDLGRNLESVIKKQEPCFQLFLRVVLVLDKVIDLYRPGSLQTSSTNDNDFHDFEQLVLDSSGTRIETSLLVTIEVLYHAVAILSHRDRSLQDKSRSSPSYLRQTLSAARITNIVDQEFHNQLSMIPMVPYAVSLSLSVAYRELRQSKIPMCQIRALGQFQVNCNILKELGEVFWAASAMADMAEQIIREMDRVVSRAGPTPRQRMSRAASVHNEPNYEDTRQGPQSSLPPCTSNESGFVDSSGTDSSLFDISLLDNLHDIDVFDRFDPNFDLDAFDNALCGNLDLCHFNDKFLF